MPERLLSGSELDAQLRLEQRCIRDGVNRYRRQAAEAVDRGEGASLKPAERLVRYWIEPMIVGVREEMRACRLGKSGRGRGYYGQILPMVDAERVALATLHTMMSQCMMAPAQGPSVARLAYAIGRDVIAEIQVDKLKRVDRESYKQLDRRFKRMTPQVVNWWVRKELDDPIWHKTACSYMGSQLIWIAIELCSVGGYNDDDFVLAFQRYHVRRDGKTVAHVRLTDDAWKLIDEGHGHRHGMRPRYMPMVVPPYPWADGQAGGYTRMPTPLVARASKAQQDALRDADLSAVYDGLNAVNSTAWRINRRILEIADRLWEQGGNVGHIPRSEDAPPPPKPHDIDTNEESLRQWKREAVATRKHNIGLRAQRVEWGMMQSVAHEMAAHERFWQTHWLDFRSRCYPVNLFLAHQGNDLCRGLMEFGHGEPVNDSRWLLIHAANVCGVDKVSFDDRIHWARDNMAEMQKWATDPLDHVGWMDQEKPFQALAAAMALNDPEAAAHLPIQVDGTCNGLQHYAALGRDREGMAVVNMLPTDSPSDIYSIVAERVMERVRYEAAQGDERAAMALPLIARSTVKQPVMTSVYGVTNHGARDQVYAALDEAGISDDTRYKVSFYLSRIVMDELKGLCPDATGIMKWLYDCARTLGKAGHIVRWTTPMGFPIVQPYRNLRRRRIHTILGSLLLAMPDESLPPKVGKQADATPPNYVHSLDATHMFQTARACYEAGIDFAAVHDSFWCHARHADRMGQILRREFASLHSQPLLNDVHRQWQALYPDVKLEPPPQQGDADVSVVMQAPYFFN